jgi:hypothetical protein
VLFVYALSTGNSPQHISHSDVLRHEFSPETSSFVSSSIHFLPNMSFNWSTLNSLFNLSELKMVAMNWEGWNWREIRFVLWWRQGTLIKLLPLESHHVSPNSYWMKRSQVCTCILGESVYCVGLRPAGWEFESNPTSIQSLHFVQKYPVPLSTCIYRAQKLQ